PVLVDNVLRILMPEENMAKLIHPINELDVV
ncbi:acrEF/envCD operon transcriptional regulator, partial [Escherichia albertii]|nr:acrEF/envCD operon transcriptional regulator [Escherichia albertii]MCZ8621036.1 acrEF/envCD operon transcriptional regulator [Escherichia albertii]MCZ8642745.1 acrEF/envCD operon transcriptional regulator [Escherichia albertii]MCZ8682537.1 acrEF/envCD operon transcriptional regulator [Escherichia albertii]MCZ8695363.1 acrEF/envCD operon transcriptional regulator [Escherichia albertii]